MTNFPDIPEWLASVAKIAWWVLAALATSSAAVLWLSARHTTWFPELPPNVVVAAWIVLVLSGFLLFFRSLDRAPRIWRKYHEGKVQRRFSRLSDRQREYLLGKFESGRRSFGIPVFYGKDRWFEELQDWNYLEYVAPMIITGDTPYTYNITRAGWQEIQRFQEKSRRRTEQ